MDGNELMVGKFALRCSAMETEIHQCSLPATATVTKRSPFGDVPFHLCDYHFDISGPHERAKPIPDVGNAEKSP